MFLNKRVGLRAIIKIIIDKPNRKFYKLNI